MLEGHFFLRDKVAVHVEADDHPLPLDLGAARHHLRLPVNHAVELEFEARALRDLDVDQVQQIVRSGIGQLEHARVVHDTVHLAAVALQTAVVGAVEVSSVTIDDILEGPPGRRRQDGASPVRGAPAVLRQVWWERWARPWQRRCRRGARLVAGPGRPRFRRQRC